MRENEASIRGRVVRDLIAHTTNDLLIGKKIKNGELRKQIGTAEPPWKCPECFTMTDDRDGTFHHGVAFRVEGECEPATKSFCSCTAADMSGRCAMHTACLPDLYNEVSHGMSVLTHGLPRGTGASVSGGARGCRVRV